MKKLILALEGIFLLFSESVYTQNRTAEGFLGFTSSVPTEMVEASITQKLVYVDTIIVERFLRGGSGGSKAPVELEVWIRQIARLQKPGQIDFIEGWADTTRWLDKNPIVDYAADLSTANARALWTFGIEKNEGAKVYLLSSKVWQSSRAVIIYRATYETIGPNGGDKLSKIVPEDLGRKPIPIQDTEQSKTVVTQPQTAAQPQVLARSQSNSFGNMRIVAGIGASVFVTGDRPNGAPAVSVGLDSKDWLLLFDAGGWGIKRDPTWFDPTGERALRIMSLGLTVFLKDYIGVSAGFAWCDEIVLQTIRTTKSWYGPAVGLKLRWREIGGSPVSIIGGLDMPYLLHSEYGVTGSEWKPGFNPSVHILWSFGQKEE